MRIAYCTNVRLPSERAHAHQIAQVCDAFVNLDHEVDIFAPRRINTVTNDYWAYYGSSRHIQLHYLGQFDPIASIWTPGVLGLWFLNWRLRRALRHQLQTTSFDLLYTRSPALLTALLATGKPTMLELHQLPRRGRAAFVRRCNRCTRVICLTSAMREALISWGVESRRLFVEPDAVDLKRFTNLPDPSIVRARLTLTTERTVVGYVGRLKTLQMEKGVMTILQALKKLQSERRYFGLIVGGPENDRAYYEHMAAQLGLTWEDVCFTGSLPAREVPEVLSACDILAMPFPDYPHYRFHMSPLKMFEYMASLRPIITSDLPTIRDVLDEKSAVFCSPGDAESFSQALRWINEHPNEAKQRAQHARSLVEHYTWEERMKRILNASHS